MPANRCVACGVDPRADKTMLKPVDGAASGDVFVCASYAAALDSINNDRLEIATFDPLRFKLKEFIEGGILHSVRNGDLR